MPEPAANPRVVLDNLRPGQKFRLWRQPKRVRRPLSPPSDRVRKDWVFEAGDTIIRANTLACHLVSGGEYPFEVPGDEYEFLLSTRVIPVEPTNE